MRFDPIADMISSIKNGYAAKKQFVAVPFSSFKAEIAKVLKEENYLDKIEKESVDNNKTNLILWLKYENKKGILSDIQQVSKTGLKVYVSCQNIPKVLGGIGTSIISTSRGVMSGRKAREDHLGGEVICLVW